MKNYHKTQSIAGQLSTIAMGTALIALLIVSGCGSNTSNDNPNAINSSLTDTTPSHSERDDSRNTDSFVRIREAQWENGLLTVRGLALPSLVISILNADTGQLLGTVETHRNNETRSRKDEDNDEHRTTVRWQFELANPPTIPCRVLAEADGSTDTQQVDDAPDDCNTNGEPTPGPDPTPHPGTSHSGRYDIYEGSKTCVVCHSTQVNQVHDSLHYQWQGPAPYAVNLTTGGKLHSINDFCGYPDINFIGLLTNLDGETIDGGCATCHVGMGAKPDPVATDAQLENIDCLVCHSDSYRRKVEQLPDGSFRFVPAPERMTVPLLEAITDIQGTPTRGTCVNCHSYAGGGCNNKRGDMEEEHREPSSASFDVHMASTAIGGAGLVCVDCHTTSEHRIAGRGSDLQATDLDEPVHCTNCHNTSPHDSNNINKHTDRVDCTVCHIPFFAKVASTDMFRDFSQPAVVDETKRLYEPFITRQANVVPEYLFWNGNSTFYEFGTEAVPGTNGKVMISAPVGNISDDNAKLFAFKHHLAVQPHDPVTGRILPLKMGILFQTGDIDASITAGADAVGWTLPNGFDFIDTERYMGLFHEVAPANEALGCNDCHNGGTRIDFSALGYTPRPERNPAIASNCASGCHGDESDEWSAGELFNGVHSRHVDHEHIACSVCHTF